MTQQQIKVLDRLRGLCSRREYCLSDVLRKASDALEGDSAAAREVVDVLVAERYVDDLRYAGAYARDKASIQGWGAAKIKYMLLTKRIDASVIAEALQEIDAERASARLMKLLESKGRSLRDDPQCRMKLLRFGLGRGYGYEEVSQAIRELGF